MGEQLSERQRRMLGFIEQFVEENGYPPTYEEIRVALGISTKSLVNHHLDALEGAGCLARMPNTPRGIRLSQSKTFRVPKLGTIAAGFPITASDPDPDDFLELTRDIVAEQEGLYALRVAGNSMIDALVNDGDIIILKQENELSGERARTPSASQPDDAPALRTSVGGASSGASGGSHQAVAVMVLWTQLTWTHPGYSSREGRRGPSWQTQSVANLLIQWVSQTDLTWQSRR
jgi:SOS regulatory protein LexA